MDLYPTIAGWCGAELPHDRTIDGRDIAAVIDATTTESPHDAFFYWMGSSLEAVRSGQWKLHFYKSGAFGSPGSAIHELNDLDADIGETTNVAAQHPEVVIRLQQLADDARHDLGDAPQGIDGTGCRPLGRVENPVPLATFDPNHPYYMAEYDLADRG